MLGVGSCGCGNAAEGVVVGKVLITCVANQSAAAGACCMITVKQQSSNKVTSWYHVVIHDICIYIYIYIFMSMMIFDILWMTRGIQRDESFETSSGVF